MRFHLGRQGGKALRSAPGEIEGAEQPVEGQPSRADDLGKAALRHAPRDIHLEEPVLGVKIAQRPRRILHIGRENMRHAMRVADHADIGAKTVEPHFARSRCGSPRLHQ